MACCYDDCVEGFAPPVVFLSVLIGLAKVRIHFPVSASFAPIPLSCYVIQSLVATPV